MKKRPELANSLTDVVLGLPTSDAQQTGWNKNPGFLRHPNQCGFAIVQSWPFTTMNAKVGKKVCQIQSKQSKNLPKDLKICQSDEISPNLVTLRPTSTLASEGH